MQRVSVGRGHERTLCLDEIGISWEHAEFRRRDGS